MVFTCVAQLLSFDLALLPASVSHRVHALLGSSVLVSSFSPLILVRVGCLSSRAALLNVPITIFAINEQI